MKKSEYMYMYNWIGLPRWIMVKNLPAKAGGIRDTDSSCGLGRSPGGRHGNPLQYYNLENPMDRGAGRLLVIGAAKSWTQLKRLSTCAGVTELLRCSRHWASQVVQWWRFTCTAGHVGSVPGLGWFPKEGNSNALQYSCLANSVDRGAWWVTKSWAWLSNWSHTHTHTHSWN